MSWFLIIWVLKWLVHWVQSVDIALTTSECPGLWRPIYYIVFTRNVSVRHSLQSISTDWKYHFKAYIPLGVFWSRWGW